MLAERLKKSQLDTLLKFDIPLVPGQENSTLLGFLLIFLIPCLRNNTIRIKSGIIKNLRFIGQ